MSSSLDAVLAHADKHIEASLQRLFELIREATFVPKKRKPTRPSKAAKAKRMEGKAKRSAVKSLRGRVTD